MTKYLAFHGAGVCQGTGATLLRTETVAKGEGKPNVFGHFFMVTFLTRNIAYDSTRLPGRGGGVHSGAAAVIVQHGMVGQPCVLQFATDWTKHGGGHPAATAYYRSSLLSAPQESMGESQITTDRAHTMSMDAGFHNLALQFYPLTTERRGYRTIPSADQQAQVACVPLLRRAGPCRLSAVQRGLAA